MKFILVDGSYYLFYRFHALRLWWKNAHPHDELGDPAANEIFVEAFNRTFTSKLKEIPKKLKIAESINFVGKDCPRGEIWRNKLYPEYKSTRASNAECAPFFAAAYAEDMFAKGGFPVTLGHEGLEADDCIAITTRHIMATYPDAEIYIITGDMDYLQLAHERVHLYNLKFSKLTDMKSSLKDPSKDLMHKILMGDKSDNIPPIFRGCGAKTAIKLIESSSALDAKLMDPEIRKAFDANTTLVDFDRIPEDLVQSFKRNCLGLH